MFSRGETWCFSSEEILQVIKCEITSVIPAEKVFIESYKSLNSVTSPSSSPANVNQITAAFFFTSLFSYITVQKVNLHVLFLILQSTTKFKIPKSARAIKPLNS